MDRPTMPPAHRDVPDDITPPGHAPVKYVVGPGDLTRGELRRLLRSASRFSGLTGWKRRFFVLRSGKLTYYAEELTGTRPV